MSPDNQTLLACEQIGVTFGSSVILTDINFSVRRGAIHALIGPNGAGKTTLANVVSGHLRKHTGHVRFEGSALKGAPWQRARRGVGRKFQVPRVFPRASAMQNLKIATRRLGAVDPDAAAWCETLGDGPAATLSHGSRQRLEWELVVAESPRLVVLDEPTAGLAHSERDLLAEQIRLHRDRFGTTFLIVEHDLEFIAAISDLVSYLEAGRLLLTDRYEVVRQDVRVRTTYLGLYA